MIDQEVSRRQFLGTSLTFTGGLLVAFSLPLKVARALAAEAPKATPLDANAFIHIGSDGQITFVINQLEMGQGVNTSIAQLIVEELDCDWSKIRSVSAPVNPIYNNPAFGMQVTGGSSSLKSSWDHYRKIGAGMREMLKTAAAKRWDVPVSQVKAENGYVIYGAKKLSYSELADEAGQLPFPENPPLKKPGEFKVIGKSMKRVDALSKANGTAEFGIDVRIPGMQYVMVARPSLESGKLKGFDESAARKVRGVNDVVRFGNKVAVLANNTHSARLGREALNAQWDLGEDAKTNNESIMANLRKNLDKGVKTKDVGDVEGKLAKAASMIEAEYEFPFLAHASMEPLNCTIHYDGEKAEFWSGHQMPTKDRLVAGRVLGLDPEKIKLNVTYAGGSFGRRGNKDSDYTMEAAQLAKIVKKPIKIVWTREDDMRGGYYRPVNMHRVRIGLDEKKNLLAWDHQIAGQSIMAGSFFETMMGVKPTDSTMTEGVVDTQYEIPAFRFMAAKVPSPVTVLWWRSVGHTHTAYVMETLIDELAEAAGEDPLALRRRMLKKSPRHLAVLKELEKLSGWGKKKPPKGRAWGLAVHESFHSVVGHVAEVSVEDGFPKVHRIWSAVHCGLVVNPEGARTQVEGAIVLGLSALRQEIKVVDGKIVNSNFLDYPVMRIQDMPKVEVAFVDSPDAPTGLGEPGLPPIAPAVANAFYRLTKQRVRKLPFTGKEA